MVNKNISILTISRDSIVWFCNKYLIESLIPFGTLRLVSNLLVFAHLKSYNYVLH